MALTLALVILLTLVFAELAIGAAKGFTIGKVIRIQAHAVLHFVRYLAGRESSPFYDPNQD